MVRLCEQHLGHKHGFRLGQGTETEATRSLESISEHHPHPLLRGGAISASQTTGLSEPMLQGHAVGAVFAPITTLPRWA